MSCIKGKGKKRQRIIHLWNLLLVADPKGMADVRFSQVANVTGTTEDYARSVWMELIRGGR